MLVVLPIESYYRDLLLEGLRNLNFSNKDHYASDNTVSTRIKVVSTIEVEDFEFQLSRGELKSISRKDLTFRSSDEQIKISCGEFDRIMCPLVAEEPSYTDDHILYS